MLTYSQLLPIFYSDKIDNVWLTQIQIWFRQANLLDDNLYASVFILKSYSYYWCQFGRQYGHWFLLIDMYTNIIYIGDLCVRALTFVVALMQAFSRYEYVMDKDKCKLFDMVWITIKSFSHLLYSGTNFSWQWILIRFHWKGKNVILYFIIQARVY